MKENVWIIVNYNSSAIFFSTKIKQSRMNIYIYIYNEFQPMIFKLYIYNFFHDDKSIKSTSLALNLNI